MPVFEPKTMLLPSMPYYIKTWDRSVRSFQQTHSQPGGGQGSWSPPATPLQGAVGKPAGWKCFIIALVRRGSAGQGCSWEAIQPPTHRSPRQRHPRAGGQCIRARGATPPRPLPQLGRAGGSDGQKQSYCTNIQCGPGRGRSTPPPGEPGRGALDPALWRNGGRACCGPDGGEGRPGAS